MSAESVPEPNPQITSAVTDALLNAVHSDPEVFFRELETRRVSQRISFPDMARSLENVLGWEISDRYAEWSSREAGRIFREQYRQRRSGQG